MSMQKRYYGQRGAQVVCAVLRHRPTEVGKEAHTTARALMDDEELAICAHVAIRLCEFEEGLRIWVCPQRLSSADMQR
jgi:hypothetical protein